MTVFWAVVGLIAFATALFLAIIAPEAAAFVRYMAACAKTWFD